MITFTVNNRRIQLPKTPSRSLLYILRHELGLTGTKDGCSKGHCGTCTVIVNGRSRRSCLIPVEKLAHKTVETIESLNRSNGLHPLQAAFIDAGAVQCGFCTPGMIMAAKALLDANPHPTEEEIRWALRHNLCRCTGYTAIIQAVKTAAASSQRRTLPQWKGLIDRVKGRPLFTADQKRAGMYYGRLLLSTLPHARITEIDIRAAVKIDGVVAVFLARDIPGRKTFGLIHPHQPVLVQDRVRYRGEPLALVVANNPLVADEARKAIQVTAAPLPLLLDPRKALLASAPHLHPGGNQMKQMTIKKGDVEQGMREAHLMVENTYTTPMVEHGYLEVEAALSYPDGAGGVVVETGSQSAYAMQEMIALSLALPLDRVRVITRPPGGAFGGKEEPTVQIHGALAAWQLDLPVMVSLSREESLLLSTKRHAMIIHYRTGVKEDGRLSAIQVNILANTGAYASLGPAVLDRAASFCSGPYRVPHVLVKATAVYTNLPPAGAMRGFGSPQVAFAAESQMNRISHQLGIDPLTLRERNALHIGEKTITGQILGPGTGLPSILKILRKEWDGIRLRPSLSKKKGLGVALAYKNVGLGGGSLEEAGAVLELGEGGQIHILVGAVDMGQGLSQTMALLASGILNLPQDSFTVSCSDTQKTPDAGVTTASRQTFLSGNALLLASERLKEQILMETAHRFFLPLSQLQLGEEISCQGQKVVTLNDLYRLLAKEGRRLRGEASYRAPSTTPFHQGEAPFLHYAYCFGGQLVLLSIQEETGAVEVEEIIAVQDLGKAINPQGAHGQICGGVMMGLGYALGEAFQEGSKSLKEQGILPITRTPVIRTILVEEEEPAGPFGAKGMAELPVSPTAPAVTGAISAACGQFITDLPATRTLKKIVDTTEEQE